MEFKWGTWWVLCDRCGFKYKSNELHEERHTGLMVCSPCHDIQNPQEYARILRTEGSIPWSRPEKSTEESASFTDCDQLTAIPISNVFNSDFTVYKGVSNGPVTIIDGVTVTVLCEWEIR